MTFPKLHHLFLSISLSALLCCTDNKGTSISGQTTNSIQGISFDTLDLIYGGPPSFTLNYFPKAVIHAARVNGCVITQRDSTSSRVARIARFDQNGNIVRDENNFFSFWFIGTIRGTFNYQYNGNDKILRMIGIPEEDSKDSLMTVWNYNTQGFLYSRDDYKFAKRLKPGADGHLPGPDDFEKYPTWNKQKTTRFSAALNIVTIETFVEGGLVNYEKYQLDFDSSKRLKVVSMFRDDSLVETTRYTLEPNSILGFIQRTMNDGTQWVYKAKAVLNEKGAQIEKIVFNEDGTEKVIMIVSYNEDATIRRIKYNTTVQEFSYNYY